MFHCYRWYRLDLRKDDRHLVKKVGGRRQGVRPRGTRKKTCHEADENDLKSLHLNNFDAMDHKKSVSQSVERLTSHGSQCPPRLAVMCDPPSVVGVEPSVVLDLLHPRSAGSSSLALPLRPDVRFTACVSVHSQAQC